VGKIKERYIAEGIAEYSKRLQRYGRFEIAEIKEQPYREPLGEKEKEQVLAGEGKRILARLNPRAHIIVLDRHGIQWDSEELAARLRALAVSGIHLVDFVIGGSHGLSPQVISRADFVWSFSELTFPHQLMRLILTEQIYRAQTILGGEGYHK